MPRRGIDISKWQGTINWPKVAEAVDFAMIRFAVGTKKNTPTLDPLAIRNIEGAIAAGVPFGVYITSYALDMSAVQCELDFTLRTLEPYRAHLRLPVAFDFEDDKTQIKRGLLELFASLERQQKGKGRRLCTDLVKLYCDGVKRAGYPSAVYMNTDFTRNFVYWDELKADHDLWAASWPNPSQSNPPAPTGNPPVAEAMIWQYSAKGRVSGIAGDVDLNVCYKDYCGANPVQPPAPPPAPARPLVTLGYTGPEVLDIRYALRGYYKTATFSPEDVEAVKAMQAAHGVTPVDGKVGPKTWAAIDNLEGE